MCPRAYLEEVTRLIAWIYQALIDPHQLEWVGVHMQRVERHIIEHPLLDLPQWHLQRLGVGEFEHFTIDFTCELPVGVGNFVMADEHRTRQRTKGLVGE